MTLVSNESKGSIIPVNNLVSPVIHVEEYIVEEEIEKESALPTATPFKSSNEYEIWCSALEVKVGNKQPWSQEYHADWERYLNCFGLGRMLAAIEGLEINNVENLLQGQDGQMCLLDKLLQVRVEKPTPQEQLLKIQSERGATSKEARAFAYKHGIKPIDSRLFPLD